jgi:5-methylcytosine-specific restriction endonuclease McrA
MVGPAGFELNITMKLELTAKRLAANKRNSTLGGQAFSAKQAALYQQNPSYCCHCNTILPQSKKNNKFCSKSCAATYNNTKFPKRKTTKIETPCLNCATLTFSKKYCCSQCSAEARKKYKTPEEKLIAVRSRVREISANYRAKLRNQTPIDADRSAIKDFYLKCPSGYEVDHIVPISKGGLHTLDNLQYLTIKENRSKSNKI